MSIDSVFVACLAAYRGEQLILMRYPASKGLGETFGLPQVQALIYEPYNTLEARLALLLNTGQRGFCVRMRVVETQLAFERIPGMMTMDTSDMPRFATIVTCAFSGYFPENCIAVKPNELPEDMVPFHRPLIKAVENRRNSDALEQSKVEGKLAKRLDLYPRRSEG